MYITYYYCATSSRLSHIKLIQVSVMQNNNHDSTFSKLSKLAGSAFATANNAKNDLLQQIKQHVESMMNGMNFVKRDEFEVVKKIAVDNQIALKKLIKEPKPKQEKQPQTKQPKESIPATNIPKKKKLRFSKVII